MLYEVITYIKDLWRKIFKHYIDKGSNPYGLFCEVIKVKKIDFLYSLRDRIVELDMDLIVIDQEIELELKG